MNTKNLVGSSLGRYHIIEPLGQGGMASVFRAYDTLLERDVAIKVIRPDVDQNTGEAFLRRFQREARALAQLDHPFILKVLDYGEQDGLPYLVMPFVHGGTLKHRMERAMPYPQAAALLSPIARALDYAHHQKIIHRDVKPANILISQSGAPLLSDFGIAKMLEPGANTQLTATGMGIGTPDYMAPEQWMGNSGPGTDIYSLGVVFYEMVTGHRPYSADTPAAVLLKHLHDPLPRPKIYIPNLPDAVEQVLFKALAKESEHRFSDMAEFADVLEKLSRDEITQIKPMPLDEATLQGLGLTIPSTKNGQTVIAPPSAGSPTSQHNLKIGLAAVGVILAGLIACVILGGIIFASGNLIKKGNTSPATAVIQNTGIPAAQTVKNTPTTPPIPPTSPPDKAPTAGVTPVTFIEGLPQDVPLLTENNGDLRTQLTQGMTMYSFTSHLPAEKVTEFYKESMLKNGWEILSQSTGTNDEQYVYMKGEKRITIIMVINQGDTCMVSIMLPPTE